MRNGDDQHYQGKHTNECIIIVNALMNVWLGCVKKESGKKMWDGGSLNIYPSRLYLPLTIM